ncbi:CMF_collapsed_G0013460.mRNA.1.CDS.1 [Saccharomyces cerevisiae]|nr:CMF_collapsed_G0013460.mRNA.1.CDS.1 [Saccharomyces cerevisiae]
MNALNLNIIGTSAIQNQLVYQVTNIFIIIRMKLVKALFPKTIPKQRIQHLVEIKVKTNSKDHTTITGVPFQKNSG